MFTPLHIQILIHYHVTIDPLPNEDAHAVINYRGGLIAYGLIERTPPNSYRLTDLGRAFLSCILSTPIPKRVFLDPRTKQEIKDL